MVENITLENLKAEMKAKENKKAETVASDNAKREPKKDKFGRAYATGKRKNAVA